LIAQSPAQRRDASRLLLVAPGATEHHVFSELPALLQPGDVLVLNETRVIAARLIGHRHPTGGRVELLLLHPTAGLAYDPSATAWTALAKPAKRLRLGQSVRFTDPVSGELLGDAQVTGEEDGGARQLEFSFNVPFEQLLERAGRLPLPPYIHNDSQSAQERYQTVFARIPGSIAAPTASLHFTPELLEELTARGIEIARISLDVGIGTFRPMHADRLDEHTMHAERYHLPTEAVAAILAAKEAGRRVVAAGTTVVRALEGAVADRGQLASGTFETSIFIRPGWTFRIVDAMITNFHLPRSTLLVLVSAFAGRERILQAYAEAIEHRYRFFSFGDAMLIV
jgi:S-adenosylmethionine:tRNA ribosyltransferase-isomerase